MRGIMLQLSDSYDWQYPSAAECRLTSEMYRHGVSFGRYGEIVRDLMLAGF